jgi:hypothetical protein
MQYIYLNVEWSYGRITRLGGVFRLMAQDGSFFFFSKYSPAVSLYTRALNPFTPGCAAERASSTNQLYICTYMPLVYAVFTQSPSILDFRI